MRLAIAIALAASGCLRANAGFHCEADSDCANGGTTGVCTGGFCSFSDPSCSGGLRYGEQSGPVANQCVAVDAGVADAPIDAVPIVPPKLLGVPAFGDITGGDVTLVTFTATVVPGDNRLMLVSVVMSAGRTTDTNPMVGSVTFGAQPMTFIANAQTGMTEDPQASRTEQWILVAPEVITGTVTVTLASSAVTIRAGQATFSGVDQVTPIRPGSLAHFGGGGPTGELDVPSATNDLVESATGHGSGIVAPDAGETAIYIDDGDGSVSLNNAGLATAPGAALVAMGWTYTQDDNVEIVGASIEPVPVN